LYASASEGVAAFAVSAFGSGAEELDGMVGDEGGMEWAMVMAEVDLRSGFAGWIWVWT
jgi:hypothetical protein